MANLKKSLSNVSGWGLNKWAKVNTFTPKKLEELVNFIKKSNSSSILVRGLGRSYGDAAQLNGQNYYYFLKFLE